MAKLDRKEDIMVDKSTFGSWRKKKGNQKLESTRSRKQGSKKTMNIDPKSNFHSI